MKTYHIQQKIRAFVNQYAIFDVTETGEKGAVVAFAEQKRLAFKEKFTMFTGEDRSTISFEVQARSVMDLSARYDVKDAEGKLLGVIGKDFKSSLLCSTWLIFAPNQEDKPLLIVRERSAGVAIARRVWELLPGLPDLIPFFIKYHFDFVVPGSDVVCATYNKITTLTDNYHLQLTDESKITVDHRVLLSLCVMMDALQSR